jgi:hypothetical protein
MTDEQAKAWMEAKWAAMGVPEGWDNLLTQALPDDVVKQDVYVWIAHFTDPEGERHGTSLGAYSLGGRENSDLTPEEVEYVASVILATARTLLKEHGKLTPVLTDHLR